MQLQHVPRLDGPASGSGCHSAAGLATVSGGASLKIEVGESYTDPIKRFSSAPERLLAVVVLVDLNGQSQVKGAPVAGSGSIQDLGFNLSDGCPNGVDGQVQVIF
jgi:hypothetical protein